MTLVQKLLVGMAVICMSFLAHGQSQDVAFTIYLIGDAGEPYVGESSNMKLLKEQLDKESTNSAIVFLGDNIYPKGMPEKGHEERPDAEKAIDGQLASLKEYQGQAFFVAGNHDWEKGKEDGYRRVLFQETYVEEQLNRGNIFLPDRACPGPVEVELSDDLVLILYDSQWLLHEHNKPGKGDGCVNGSNEEVLIAIAEALERNAHRQVILAAHHPIFTYGIHGGVTTFKDHIFPLTELNDALYIPLPGIGSIYPLYRKSGHLQDTNHDTYKAITSFLIKELEKYPGIIHAAGHEHSIQYSLKENVHYIVSGSGVKTTHVRKRGYAQFVEDKTGFAKLIVKTNGQVVLQMWQSEDEEDPIAYEAILRR